MDVKIQSVVVPGLVQKFVIEGGIDVLARALRFYFDLVGVKGQDSIALITASQAGELKMPSFMTSSPPRGSLPLMVVFGKYDEKKCDHEHIFEPEFCRFNQAASSIDALLAAIQDKIDNLRDFWRHRFIQQFGVCDEDSVVGWRLESEGVFHPEVLTISMVEVHIPE